MGRGDAGRAHVRRLCVRAAGRSGPGAAAWERSERGLMTPHWLLPGTTKEGAEVGVGLQLMLFGSCAWGHARSVHRHAVLRPSEGSSHTRNDTVPANSPSPMSSGRETPLTQYAVSGSCSAVIPSLTHAAVQNAMATSH